MESKIIHWVKLYYPNKWKMYIGDIAKEEDKKVKTKESISVKQSFLIEFDRKYRENCDNKFMSRKMRGVSIDNPF